MRPIDIVRRLCPRARPEYLAAFENGDDQIKAAGITTPRRLAHFLAQVLHETDGLKIFVESAGYTRENLSDAWDQGNWHSYFPSKSAMMDMAGHGEELFNIVYGNRMGNGPPSSGDGFRYRGRGVLQTTGRGAYRAYGRRCGVDFEGNPDLVITADHALKPALAEWVDGKCNAMADNGDIRAITKKINGGYNGLNSRMSWLRRVESVIGEQVVEFSTPKPKAETKPAPELDKIAAPTRGDNGAMVPASKKSVVLAVAASIAAFMSGYGISWWSVVAVIVLAAAAFTAWKMWGSK